MCLGFKKHGVREGQRARDGGAWLCSPLGRKACVASVALVRSGELFRSFDDCVVGNVRHRHRMELGNNPRRSRAPELHTAAPGEMTQGLAHCRGMSSAEQEARKGDKRKLQPEPSLVYIIRNTHVNTPNTHACHTHTKKLVPFLWQTLNSLAWVRDKEKAYFDSWFWSKVKGHLGMALLLPECSGSIG